MSCCPDYLEISQNISTLIFHYLAITNKITQSNYSQITSNKIGNGWMESFSYHFTAFLILVEKLNQQIIHSFNWRNFRCIILFSTFNFYKKIEFVWISCNHCPLSNMSQIWSCLVWNTRLTKISLPNHEKSVLCCFFSKFLFCINWLLEGFAVFQSLLLSSTKYISIYLEYWFQ